MRKRRGPPQEETDDAAAVFRAAVGKVRELPPAPAPPPRPRPSPVPRMAARDAAQALDALRQAMTAHGLESGDALNHRRDGVPARVMQRLRRGDYSAQDEIDLHHASAAQAEGALRRFLDESGRAGLG